MTQTEKISNILDYIKKKHGVRHVVDATPPALVGAPASGVCPLCRGRGFTRDDVQPGHPNFGKPIPCACKIAERKTRKQQELIDLSGITTLTRFKGATFAKYVPTTNDTRRAFKQAKLYADDPVGWFILTGPCGCGKTHLAVAIAKQLLEAGYTVLVMTVPDIMDRLRSTFSPSTEQTFDEMFTQMKEVEVLVLDDFGAEQGSDWVKEKVFQLFNHRYNKSLPTIVTSNNIDLEGIDHRVYSRLHDRELVTMIKILDARDCRPHGPNQDDEE
jgi:DNA replication protein DnaC